MRKYKLYVNGKEVLTGTLQEVISELEKYNIMDAVLIKAV